MTPKMASAISSLIAAHLIGPDALGLHRVVREWQALPLYSDIGGTILITPAGQFLAVSRALLKIE